VVSNKDQSEQLRASGRCLRPGLSLGQSGHRQRSGRHREPVKTTVENARVQLDTSIRSPSTAARQSSAQTGNVVMPNSHGAGHQSTKSSHLRHVRGAEAQLPTSALHGRCELAVARDLRTTPPTRKRVLTSSTLGDMTTRHHQRRHVPQLRHSVPGSLCASPAASPPTTPSWFRTRRSRPARTVRMFT